ncbi:MAG: Protein YceI [Acidimicrobiaceae bacterium]|nr:Protein YceI [Acidimicrobiaceae bacterium]
MSITTEPTLTTGIWNVDPTHSEVGFTVRHLGLFRVRGRFNEFDGVVDIAEDPTDSSLQVAVELTSVDTNNAARDGHLQGADFLDAESHPQMIFRSTAVRDNALIGDLTLRGITTPVELDLEFHGVSVDPYATTRAGFSARGRVRRSDFGIDFNAPFGLDRIFLSDEVEIELEIQLVPGP